MTEEWRAVPDFEGFYEVSNLGMIRSVGRKVKRGSRMLTVNGRIMCGSAAGKGYRKIILCRNGKQTHRYIHNIVLEAFVAPRSEGMEAAHGNGIRHDNRLSNLRWDTRAGNFADKIIHGTSAVGDRHGRRKLTAAEVEAIRQTPALAPLSASSLASAKLK